MSTSSLHRESTDSLIMLQSLDAVHVDDIKVLGCGILSWKPPRGSEGEELGYVVRYFDGETYDSTSGGSYKRIHCYFEGIGRQWDIAEELPTDGRTVYADVSIFLFLQRKYSFHLQIQAQNSAGRVSPYSERIVVAGEL